MIDAKSEFKAKALVNVSEAQKKNGQLNLAMETVNSIDVFVSYKRDALSKLSKNYLKIDKYEKVRRSF